MKDFFSIWKHMSSWMIRPLGFLSSIPIVIAICSSSVLIFGDLEDYIELIVSIIGYALLPVIFLFVILKVLANNPEDLFAPTDYGGADQYSRRKTPIAEQKKILDQETDELFEPTSEMEEETCKQDDEGLTFEEEASSEEVPKTKTVDKTISQVKPEVVDVATTYTGSKTREYYKAQILQVTDLALRWFEAETGNSVIREESIGAPDGPIYRFDGITGISRPRRGQPSHEMTAVEVRIVRDKRSYRFIKQIIDRTILAKNYINTKYTFKIDLKLVILAVFDTSDSMLDELIEHVQKLSYSPNIHVNIRIITLDNLKEIFGVV